jgi:hypothetical protein
MARLFLKVEDAFSIRQRGVLLAPLLEADHCAGVPLIFAVQLRRIDGTVVTTTGSLLLVHDAIHPIAVLLPGMQITDVPIGTELWIPTENEKN